jgi:phosphoglycerol transferase MdoB-like AlkP superfamily enzyme
MGNHFQWSGASIKPHLILISALFYYFPIQFLVSLAIASHRTSTRVSVLGLLIVQSLYYIIAINYLLYTERVLSLDQIMAMAREAVEAVMAGGVPMHPLAFLAGTDTAVVMVAVWCSRWGVAPSGRLLQQPQQQSFMTGLSLAVVMPLLVFTVLDTQYGSPRSVLHYTEALAIREFGIELCTLSQTDPDKAIYDDVSDLSGYVRVEEPQARGERRNIVVIQVESLDAQALFATVEGRPIAPCLDALALRSVYFRSCLSLHLGGGSSDCEFSILNNIEPLPSFAALKLRRYDFGNSIIKQLGKSGYDAFAFHGNDGAYYSRSTAYQAMGFTGFYDINRMHLASLGWGAPDAKVFEYAYGKFISHSGSALYYVITMTSHVPYASVYRYGEPLFLDVGRGGSARDYLNSIHYTDACIGHFVDSILHADPATIVVVVGDHTPPLPDAGTDSGAPLFTPSTMTMNGTVLEYVPLIIYSRDLAPRTIADWSPTFTDIGVTLLELSRMPFSIATKGIDLLDGSPTRAEDHLSLRGYGELSRSDVVNRADISLTHR